MGIRSLSTCRIISIPASFSIIGTPVSACKMKRQAKIFSISLRTPARSPLYSPREGRNPRPPWTFPTRIWTGRNGTFQLNGLDPETQLDRAGRRHALAERCGAATSDNTTLIVCDPPTFSASKRMTGVFDVGRQHPDLINGCLGLLRPGGILYFSTNDRGFKLEKRNLTRLRLHGNYAGFHSTGFSQPAHPSLLAVCKLSLS